jgi:hypothetical protein
MTDKKLELYRQGDVVLERLTGQPRGITKRNTAGDVVLRFGTATGHSHRFTKGAVVHTSDDAEFLEITDDTADLVHDEHDTVVLPRGWYKVVLQREHTAQGIRNVQD